MIEWLSQQLAALAASPPLQGMLAGLATFVLEDPTTIGCGLLVADQRMAFATALVGVSLGIAVGDIGLYGIGRALGGRVTGWGPITPERVSRAGRWFERNLVLAVVMSRFVPGMRLPTYVAAGAVRAPLLRFAAVAIGASLLWTTLLLTATVAIGAAILPLLGSYRWPVALTALAALVVLQRSAARSIADHTGAADRVVSHFEFWPPWLFYIPVAGYWMWLAIRHRGPLLPTAANPSIYSGGFIGESKSQILDLVPAPHRRWLADFVVMGIPADVTEAHDRALAALAEEGIDFPVVAKPDVGQRGDGVQPVRSADELRSYLARFPAGERLVLQRLVGSNGDGPREAGVLYWRLPGEAQGRITSITLKQFPELIGDGRRTVRQLIAADPRASRVPGVYQRRHAAELERVLEPGEGLPLVFAGNHCQGAIFTDGTAMATLELERRIDEIACAMDEFHFGRFDIRFDDFDAFLRGEDLKIIEINGASGEATHIWDASARLGDAYRTLFAQFRALFVIGAGNRRRGHRPVGLVRFLRDALAYRRMARHYPPTS